LALFIFRRKATPSLAPRFLGRTGRVRPTVELTAAPDTTIQLGIAEDGLPLLLESHRLTVRYTLWSGTFSLGTSGNGLGTGGNGADSTSSRSPRTFPTAASRCDRRNTNRCWARSTAISRPAAFSVWELAQRAVSDLPALDFGVSFWITRQAIGRTVIAVAQRLKHLHDQGNVHGDLKPAKARLIRDR
jgi:hypothetical protein